MSSNFRCENSKHGKVVVPEALVRTEMEEAKEKQRIVEEKQRREEELSRLHEGTHHIDPNEKDMLRGADIESVALNPAEQEKMIQEYNRSGENKQQQGSIDRPNVPATSHLHRGLSQDTRPSGNNSEAMSTNQRPKDHFYDTVQPQLSSLGHHSASAGNILSHQNSQPGNIQSGEDAMLRKANVKTWEMNEQGQEERLKEFNRQRDEKRKIEAARVVKPYGSSVDPPDNCHRENYPPPIYDNMPGGGNKQPTVMAIASESQDSHQFVMGSRVEFSDPPRYGEIRWMGNFPQVNGLIVGVELVSCHCT